MSNLEKRLEVLEEKEPTDSPAFEEFMRSLPPLKADGSLDWDTARPEFARVFVPWLAEQGTTFTLDDLGFSDPLECGLARLIETMTDGARSNPFIFERYRARVPTRVLAWIYNRMRNYNYGPEIRQRIWRLAGLADADGNLLYGYHLDAQGTLRNSEPQPRPDALQ